MYMPNMSLSIGTLIYLCQFCAIKLSHKKAKINDKPDWLKWMTGPNSVFQKNCFHDEKICVKK